jgi:hypothetical protein
MPRSSPDLYLGEKIMAGGFCSNPSCQVLLTQDNCYPSAFKVGYGYCRDCYSADHKMRYEQNSEPIRRQSRLYRKQYKQRIRASERTIEGKHRFLRRRLYKEKVSKTDMLWHVNFYRELMRDGKCHYCGLGLSIYGAGLDRMNNSLPYPYSRSRHPSRGRRKWLLHPLAN